MRETHFFQSNKALLVVGLLVYNILAEVCFVLKSFQVLSYWSLALSLIEEGNISYISCNYSCTVCYELN